MLQPANHWATESERDLRMAEVQKTLSLPDLQVGWIRSTPFLRRYLQRQLKMTRCAFGLPNGPSDDVPESSIFGRPPFQRFGRLRHVKTICSLGQSDRH